MSDIFISYSQADRECAHAVAALLEAHGVKCWIASRDISEAESDRTTFGQRCRHLPGAG